MSMPTLVNLIFLGAALLLGAIGAIFGFFRGISRQTIRFITVILSAVVSFLACLGIYPALLGYFEGMSHEDFIGFLGTFGIGVEGVYADLLSCFDASMIAYVMSLPLGLIVLPLIFVIVFVIVSLLMLILHTVLCGAFAFTKKRNNIITRVAGLALGFLQGVVVTAIVLMPAGGLMTTVEDSIALANEKHPDANNAVALQNYYDSWFEGTENNPVIGLTKMVSGVVYSSYCDAEVDGEDIDLRDTVDSVVDMVVVLGDLAYADFNCLTEQEQIAFSKLTADIHQDKYLSVVVSGFLRFIATAVKEGYIIVTYEEPVGGFFTEYIRVFSTSTKDNLGGDIITTENLYYLMCEADILLTLQESPDKVYTKFAEVGPDGTTLFGRMSREFDKNPRMSGLSHKLTELSMSLLLAGRGQDMEKTAEAMNDVAETLESVIAIDKESFATEEEYKTAVNDSLGTTLEEHGIELTDEQLAELSDHVIEDFGGKESITEADLADFMVKYYDINALKQAMGQ
ncbi:MAG: hypothetical protein J6L90_04035 [Clostridia bacterium]|nr:hypothetical protein [Clostridia bacterium]